MKRQYHLLALLCLALAVLVTGCNKADDSTESSLTVAQTCSECGRECPEGQMLCDECGGRKEAAREKLPRRTLEKLVIILPSGMKLEMKKIPAGSFLMGSPVGEIGREFESNETQHRVTITRDYWLGTFEVTQEQWAAMMGYPRVFAEANLPVENVSWEDAKEFCERLNNNTSSTRPDGYQFDLPTEAQWEYACRAGTTTALNNGMNLTDIWSCPNLDEVAWYDENSNGSTHPVGQKEPNAWGLYDMHGNASEWCRDAYAQNYGEDPEFLRGQGYSLYRVCRGGDDGSRCHASVCRSAYRRGQSPGRSSGFRLALVPVAPAEEVPATAAEMVITGDQATITLPGDVRLTMQKIPAGSFMMGSPENEQGHSDDEKQHQVTLTKDYWLGTFEVTQAQWKAVVGNNPSYKYFQGDDLPVEQINWGDAKAFCEMLNQNLSVPKPDGYRFDLPTEAQWEYACRAGTTGPYHGNLEDIAWYGENSESSPHPVGQKQPNAWGLYDMHGNVSEWCRDRRDWDDSWENGYAQDPEFLRMPTSDRNRVYRGGNWRANAKACRSAWRRSLSQDNRYDDLGFRLALVPVYQKEEAAEASLDTRIVMLPGDVKLEMKKIQAGSFTMGSPLGEAGRRDEARHQVTLTKDYWMGTFEVTQAQWQTVMGSNPSHSRGDDLPVEQVSWEDAKEFCEKLNADSSIPKPDGYRFDLPTEAQWEYACRAGTTLALNNGRNLYAPSGGKHANLDEVGWSWGDNGSSAGVHPVGQKQPNAWGLYDMHGNVSEWCRDWYEEDYADDPEFLRGQASGSSRGYRGGGWHNYAQSCRSADRNDRSPGDRYINLGFRLALVPAQEKRVSLNRSKSPVRQIWTFGDKCGQFSAFGSGCGHRGRRERMTLGSTKVSLFRSLAKPPLALRTS